MFLSFYPFYHQQYLLLQMDALNLTQSLSKYIIRPPRAQYKLKQLGPNQFQHASKIYQRIDFIVSIRSFTPKDIIHQIKASFYHEKYQINPSPTIIYLHGNSSSRLSAKNYLFTALTNGYNFVCYDYRGAGQSDGAYLTLGYLEKEDLLDIINHIDKYYGPREYILWGRSMGAVTSILFAAKYQRKVRAIVADSPFGDLQQVIIDLAEKKASLFPQFLVSKLLKEIQKHIRQKIMGEYGPKIKFQISRLKPIKEIKKIDIPVFFIGSKSDELVNVKQIQTYYEMATTYKQLQILQGGHNQIRPQHLKQTVIQFLNAVMKSNKRTSKKRRVFSYQPKIQSELNIIKEKAEQKREDEKQDSHNQNETGKKIYNRKVLWQKLSSVMKGKSNKKQKKIFK